MASQAWLSAFSREYFSGIIFEKFIAPKSNEPSDLYAIGFQELQLDTDAYTGQYLTEGNKKFQERQARWRSAVIKVGLVRPVIYPAVSCPNSKVSFFLTE